PRPTLFPYTTLFRSAPPLFRIHTIVSPSDFPIVTPEGAIRIAKGMLSEQRWADFEKHRDSDFSYEIPGVSRFRVNAHYQRNSVRSEEHTSELQSLAY